MVQKDKHETIHQNILILFCVSYFCEESYQMNSILVEDIRVISTTSVKKEQKKREKIFKNLFNETTVKNGVINYNLYF